MLHHVQVLNSVHIFEYQVQKFDQKSAAIEILYKEQMLILIEYMYPKQSYNKKKRTKNIYYFT
jgi:hypothetical protein